MLKSRIFDNYNAKNLDMTKFMTYFATENKNDEI